MGHYSVSCFISGLEIIEGKCIFIPLRKTDYSFLKKNNSIEAIPLGEGVYTHFHPLTLPMICHYDHYGQIDYVEDSINKQLIEKFFNLKAENMVNSILDNSFKFQNENITGCFIHYDVFNDLKNYQTIFGDLIGNSLQTLDLNSYNLKKLGFKLIKEIKKENLDPSDRRNYFQSLYKHDNIKNLEIWSNDHSVYIENNDNIYRLIDLYNLCKNKFEYSLNIDYFLENTKYEVLIDESLSNFKNKLKLDNILNHLYKDLDIKHKPYLFTESFRQIHMTNSISKFNPLFEIYKEVLVGKNSNSLIELKKLLSNYLGIYYACYNMNKAFIPNVCFNQDPEFLSKALLIGSTLKNLFKNEDIKELIIESIEKSFPNFKKIINEK